jgi:hypothetical protein
MPSKHELEIEISADGNVQVHVKGAKGKQCLQYVELFSMLGPVTAQKHTGEYYEPDPTIGISDFLKTSYDK